MTTGKKELLKAQIEEMQREIDELTTEVANIPHRICRLSSCGVSFPTLDNRQYYCCKEHYLESNRERTKQRNLKRKST